MSRPTLAERASQRRLLNRALEVRCPDLGHHWARAGVPCRAPSEAWPWGWVCMARIEKDADTRAARDVYLVKKREAEAIAERRARLEQRVVTERARIAARIAEAAHLAGEEDR